MRSCCGAGGSTRGKKPDKGRAPSHPEKRYLSFFTVMTIFAGLVAAGCLFYYVSPGGFTTNVATEAQAAVTPVTAGNEVVLPESAFADGKAYFFEHKTPDGKKVRYFVIKSSDGVIRAAYDACDVCWEAGKGYKQRGEFMVCQNCGKQFHSSRVNVVTGGCNPGALTRSVRDGKVIIPLQALNEGKRYFK